MRKSKITTKAKEPIRLRTKKLANGNLSIYLDTYKNGARSYEFLKLYLIPEKTKEDKERNEKTLRVAKAIQAQKVIELQNEQHGFTSNNTGKANFIQYMEAQEESYKKKGSPAYSMTIHNTIVHLKAYKGEKVTFKVDKSYLNGFIDFLNTTNGMFDKPLSEATKALYFRVVVVALNKAVRSGILQANPSHKIEYKDRPKAGEATKEYLTFDEVKRLAETDCPHTYVKRAFMFSCFCGLRYSDVRGLKWGQIHTVENGIKRLEIKQQKTKEPLYLPLSDNALQWLPDKGTAKDNDNVFDLPDISTVERALSKWAKVAGIEKRVTFHVSRHTAATLLITFGADIYTVSKILGHTSVKTTQIYAKIVDESKRKAVALIPTIKLSNN